MATVQTFNVDTHKASYKNLIQSFDKHKLTHWRISNHHAVLKYNPTEDFHKT